MIIEIHQPELEALIQQRLDSGVSVEEMLFQAVRFSTLVHPLKRENRTGAALIAAMQAMPYKDVVDIEPPRHTSPVRDVAL